MWYKVFILPCGFRPGNAHKTRKTKSLFFVLCHGVPPIAVIDYIFNFCNDMVFYCLIYTHIFAHGVLNGQRLYNNIPLNDLIFLHRHMCAFFFVLPLVLVRNQSRWFSHEKIFAHRHRTRFETEASQQLEMAKNLAFWFPRSHNYIFTYVFFHYPKRMLFLFKASSWNETSES